MTLIELLMVLVIVGVLCAMMMESLAGVRKKVDAVECLNGRRVWKINREIGELITEDKRKLGRCWQCHPSIP